MLWPFVSQIIPNFRRSFAERRARPFPYACRGSRPAERPGRRESRGDQAQGGGAGGEHGRTRESCRPRPARDSQGIGRQGFVGLGGLRLAFCAANRSRSIARGRRAAEGGADRPLRAFGRSRAPPPRAGPSGDRVGAPTTQHPRPTRPPVCVSGSRTRPTLGEDYLQGCRAMIVLSGCRVDVLSCRCRSRATSCLERAMGSVGSSAERRRPLPGPGMLCQPCGGHPL